MFTREGVATWETGFGLPYLLGHLRRSLSAAISFIRARLPAGGRGIHVPEMSPDWLARHASDSGKHGDE